MQYNTFLAMIIPFINARWNSIMFPPQSIEATVNLSVQQIYNEYKWKFKFVDEIIDTFVDTWTYFVWTTAFPIQYSLWLEYTENTIVKELRPEHSVTEFDELENAIYVVWTDNIKVREEQTYTFTYVKDYLFLSYVADPSLEIPLPNRFIPALYYLVLSQLDLIDVQQLQGQPANNFNKYQYEMKNLKDNDMQYSAQLIWANPQ